MEPARSTGSFNRKITVADSNNIIAILDLNSVNSKYQIFEQDYIVETQSALEDLKVTVGLMGLAEAPWPDTNALMSESEQMAEIARIRTQGQKISLGLYTAMGNAPWQYESEVVLQNQGGSETHVPILVPFLSSNETLLIGGDFKLGVKIEPKWNQPLKANDYLVIRGTYKQIVSFSKKKDDDVEFLAARIEALELALEGRLTNLPFNSLLGKNVGTGTVEVLSQNQFVNTYSAQTIVGNKAFTGFTTLGDNVAIKVKLIRGTTPTIEGNIISIAHGLDSSKIVGIQSLVNHSGSGSVADSFDTYSSGFEYDVWLDPGVVNLQVKLGSSQFVLDKPFSVLIFYIS